LSPPLLLVWRELGTQVSTSSPGPSARSKWQSEKPLAKAAKGLQKFVRISSRKHDEMSSFCLNNKTKKKRENKQGCQTLETTSEKGISSCVSSSGQGVSLTTILNEEKALGTRWKHCFFSIFAV